MPPVSQIGGIVLGMAFVHEVQVKTAGFPGAPGFTNLYFATTVSGPHDADFQAAHQFFEDCRHGFPTGWTATVQPSGRVLEETTGILGTITTAPAAALNPSLGDSGTAYGSGVSGFAVSWLTGTVGPRRLIRGRTFMVPAAATAYAFNGTIDAGLKSVIAGAAANLIASATDFIVWRRPVLGTGGVAAPVLAAHVSDSAVFLSSRRS